MRRSKRRSTISRISITALNLSALSGIETAVLADCSFSTSACVTISFRLSSGKELKMFCTEDCPNGHESVDYGQTPALPHKTNSKKISNIKEREVSGGSLLSYYKLRYLNKRQYQECQAKRDEQMLEVGQNKAEKVADRRYEYDRHGQNE